MSSRRSTIYYNIMTLNSIENHIKIIEIHNETSRSVKTTYRRISDIFSSYNRYSETAIENSLDKFEHLGFSK